MNTIPTLDLAILRRRVREAVLAMNVRLPADVDARLRALAARETGPGRTALARIVENLDAAAASSLPACQDTGMVWVLAEVGNELYVPGLRDAVEAAVAEAYRDGYFRASVVQPPLGARTNTRTNLPTVFHHVIVPGRGLTLHLLAKGFGSENCSRCFMLKPTATRAEVIDAVRQTVRDAGGGPCPPVVLGVGLGGTLDHAAFLAKKALTRSLDDHHPDPDFAALESELLDAVNATGIGAAGLGGMFSALGVKVEHAPTHIAGLPLVVTVNCWADRRARVELHAEDLRTP